jgi:hypothetical protein
MWGIYTEIWLRNLVENLQLEDLERSKRKMAVEVYRVVRRSGTHSI